MPSSELMAEKEPRVSQFLEGSFAMERSQSDSQLPLKWAVPLPSTQTHLCGLVPELIQSH